MLVPGFLQKTTIRTKRILMYYLAAMNFMFVYTILAYSIAVFLKDRFPDTPNAIFLVGLILGTASFFALFVDVFWAYLQRIKAARLLFLWALCGLAFTVSIFLFSQFDVEVFQPFKWALFTVVAAFSYGWSYDLYEVTMTTYILKRSPKEEFAQNISQKKVSEAIGMLGGLIVGGIALSFGSQVAQTFLLFFLFAVFLFVKHHFDQEEDEVPLQFSETSLVNWKEVFALIAHPDRVATAVGSAKDSVREGVLKLSHETAEAVKNLPEQAKHTADEVLDTARKKLIDLLMKEEEMQQRKDEKPQFEFKKMMNEVWVLFSEFTHIFSRNTPFAIFWVMAIVMFFSFWDTMAITFQPLFLARFADQLGPGGKALGGMIMGLFILPVFALQIPFAKMADKRGRYVMILLGIAISGVSLLMLGLIDSVFGGRIVILIFAGMLNSVGYAAAFSPAQAMFVAQHQKYIYEKTGKKLDNEAGAAPLRLVLNIGNIFGQMAGGFIFAFLGFTSGFLIFGVLLLTIALFTLPFLGKLKKSKTSLPEVQSFDENI